MIYVLDYTMVLYEMIKKNSYLAVPKMGKKI